jgi:molecular chaperone GrpE
MTTEREETPTAEPVGEETPESVEALKAFLEDERAKARQFYGNWQRAAADYQNFKRRVEEERSELSRFANAALVINLLPIVDDFERAFVNIDPHVAGLNWVDGVRQIQKKLVSLLEVMGVSEIQADGELFDPALHEAVSQGPGEENRVIAVAQKGYRLGDKVLRPSMVVVGNGTGSGQVTGDSGQPGTID